MNVENNEMEPEIMAAERAVEAAKEKLVAELEAADEVAKASQGAAARVRNSGRQIRWRSASRLMAITLSQRSRACGLLPSVGRDSASLMERRAPR